MLQKLEEYPPWLRMLQIVLGAICITLSMVIIVYLGPAIFSIIIVLSVILLVIGIERVATGIASSRTNKSRLINIGIGLLIVAFSIVLMQFPIFTFAILILLGAIALLFSGISRIVHGIRGDSHGRSRALQVGVGVISLGISITVMVHPVSFGLPLLGVLISIAFLISGIEMMALGISGKPKDRIIPRFGD
jgi:uncharacterized membrane protein HdeD (DUF308 family)